jgi:hypothetical protein
MWTLIMVVIHGSVIMLPHAGKVYYTKAECEAVARAERLDPKQYNLNLNPNKDYFFCAKVEELN